MLKYFLPLLTSKFRNRVRAPRKGADSMLEVICLKEREEYSSQFSISLGNRIPGMTGLSHRVTPGLPGRIPGWMTTHQPALPFKSVMKRR